MGQLALTVGTFLLAGCVLVVACTPAPVARKKGTSSSGSSSGDDDDDDTDPGEKPGSSGTTSGSTGGPPTGPDEGIIPHTSIWRTQQEWYRPITDAPLAAHSAEMMAAIPQWGTSGNFNIDFGISVLDGAGAPKVNFTTLEEESPNDSDKVPVPIPAKGYVEGDHSYESCPLENGDDCHMIILDKPNNRLYETYHSKKTGAQWTGFVAMWKIDTAYPRDNRNKGCTSAEAGGMAIAPGLIGYKETKAGKINHALRFIMPNEFIRGVKGNSTIPDYVYPASHGTTAGDAVAGLPYGGRLRLKASFDESAFEGAGAKAVIKALKTYGMILSDGGVVPLVAESAKVHNDADGTATWEGLLAGDELSTIGPENFEVIAIPKGDPRNANAGWYSSKADYEGQMQKPFEGCENGPIQP